MGDYYASIDWYYMPNPEDEDGEEVTVSVKSSLKTCINCKHYNTLGMFCKKSKRQVSNNTLCDIDSFEAV